VKSREILASSTSPQAALKAAKQLVGCWPHARPPEPETYAAALASVLAQYPLGLVQECVDPRTGLARGREFPPTVAAVVEWCDVRLNWHKALADFRLRASKQNGKTFTDVERAKGHAALIGLRKTIAEGGNLAALTFEQAAEIGSTS
jgi:hypothetical protein